MISKRTRGSDMGGLVRYLMGPGEHNEHVEQRVVAVSEGLDVALFQGLSKEEIRDLYRQLDSTRVLFPDVGFKDDQYVWHTSFSIPESDGVLSDERWAEIANRVMDDMGFVEEGIAVAPWAAFRHGKSKGKLNEETGVYGGRNDHIHLAVSKVREDGTKVNDWQDLKKLSKIVREIEADYGLTVVDGRTAGVVVVSTRAEVEKAERLGLVETDREKLARVVRSSACVSKDEAEFVRRLSRQGVVARPYLAKGSKGVTGYSVAVKTVGKQVWFGGGKLAKDLRLPALRQGWGKVDDQVKAWKPDHRGKGLREDVQINVTAWDEATARTKAVRKEIAGLDPSKNVDQIAGVAGEASGVFATLSQRVEQNPGSLAETSRTLSKTAQLADTKSTALKGIALVAAQATIGGKSESAGWLILVTEMMRLAETIQQLHQARNELFRVNELKTNQTNLTNQIQKQLATTGGKTPQHLTPHKRQQEELEK